jgi:hypothetical protein
VIREQRATSLGTGGLEDSLVIMMIKQKLSIHQRQAMFLDLRTSVDSLGSILMADKSLNQQLVAMSLVLDG